MEIRGKVHLMFEQSGVFKREFKKLGYEASCYDIQNNFGETDHQIDLFAEIETAYMGGGKCLGYNQLRRFGYGILPLHLLFGNKSDVYEFWCNQL